jgi:hypothetical protein
VPTYIDDSVAALVSAHVVEHLVNHGQADYGVDGLGIHIQQKQTPAGIVVEWVEPHACGAQPSSGIAPSNIVHRLGDTPAPDHRTIRVVLGCPPRHMSGCLALQWGGGNILAPPG